MPVTAAAAAEAAAAADAAAEAGSGVENIGPNVCDPGADVAAGVWIANVPEAGALALMIGKAYASCSRGCCTNCPPGNNCLIS